MEKSGYVLLLFIVAICLFAYQKEKTEQCHTYARSIPSDIDSKSLLYKKISICLSSNRYLIKWRRCFLGSVLITILLFALVHFRFPTPKEIILYVFIIYVVFYIWWVNITENISNPIEKIGKTIIRKLKSK